QSLTPRKLASSTPESPNKYELGTPPFADLAGVSAAVDHMAGLVAGNGTRRERIITSMTAVAAYQKALAGHMLDSLRAMPKVHVFGKLKDKTPTAYFTVAGYEPLQITQKLTEGGVNAWNGHNYAWEVTGALGIRDKGSAVRVGLSLYNNEDDVERLLKIVGAL
ncbi:MAG: aminotransferase class V-fold PLP-dependent enzyme, partial [Actinobacteria bacterium]|nr:aminotransferase class V-fold PLP-dependent enzyme [Actinomycetota bacterium]